MPYIELPERQLRMYYVCNVKIAPNSDFPPGWDPESYLLDPEKPTLLFVHAGTCSAQAFTGQFGDARLVQAYNLIAFDSRFHGRTESTSPTFGPEVPFNVEDAADDLMAAMDTLGFTDILMVGEGSLGASTCTWTAIKRPHQVKAIVLVSPGFIDPPVEVADMMLHNWYPLACRNKNGGGDQTGGLPDEAIQVVNSFFFGNVDREGGRRKAYLQHFQARYGTGRDAGDLGRLVAFFRRAPIPLHLRQTIIAPILIVQGGVDTKVSPLHQAEEWKAGFTSARGGADLRTITGAPHLLSRTDYSIANRFVLAFFKRSIER